MGYLFYSLGPKERPVAPPPLPPDYSCRLWRPSPFGLRPPGAGFYPYVAFWVMHRLHFFAHGDYAVFLIRFGKDLVFQAAVTPPDFRYPFMGAGDVQVGNVLTDPQHRGRGLAPFSLASIIEAMRADGRTFWYVTEETNVASRRAAEKAGFSIAGVGNRSSLLGLPFLVRYRMVATGPGGNRSDLGS
jgi:RimJ/RimL family protein N-acetyltransferase